MSRITLLPSSSRACHGIPRQARERWIGGISAVIPAVVAAMAATDIAGRVVCTL